MLIEHNLFGVSDKVADAINLLREHEPPEGYYLCFSGGKDSVVIYDLAVKAGVKFDAHHNITTVEPPVLCPFGTLKNIEIELERWPQIINVYKKACNRLVELYRSEKPSMSRWKTGDDLFNWWIDRHRKITVAEDCNSIPLFSEDDGSVL